MKVTFPVDFWWGGATSGPQNEGRFHKPHVNVFDYHYDTKPEDFFRYVGPDVASDFYHLYESDIALFKDLGFNSLRTSIQWTRLIDNLEEGSLNPEGVAYYNRVIDALLAAGIRPIINLHHFDLPIELYERYGGWESKHVVELFVKFARRAFECFGDRVTDWMTFNEPMVVVEGQYLYGFHYPMLVDGKKAVQVAYNLQLASAKAIQAYRQINQNPAGRVTIALNLTPAYPASQTEEDLAAAHFANLFVNRLFLDASVKGHFPEELVAILAKDGVLWESTPEELAIIRDNRVDYIGVNYYHPHRVKAPEISPNSLTVDWMPQRYFNDYQMPGRRMNVDKGWEIYPQALYDIAKNLQDNYDNIPWFVSENGIGVSREERYLDQTGIIQDQYRIQFFSEHLYWLNRAMQEGANCFGYHVWTPVDGWSWLNAYKNRYGLISNDIRTQTRTVKKSGWWFKDLTANHGFEWEEMT
ncbi:glycoside hydrolase family 1 protein [Abiotrophia defectiva]|uniref:glycoside hydrolase family 1 protein n=1 Tax=Abiotrophia defectiva TaxID=46125 RepID=UPI00227EE175|nr:glycoside hydrolase family 1 protein [Abiotrophia defectiva]MCY7224321.1 glycoside hydrolase family 1 protein [Abiotrophia defectiva]